MTPTNIIDIYRCHSTQEVKEVIEKIFKRNGDLLPKSKNALIFLKPNLNSDMCGLTGNTTDLRILVAIIEYLKNRGYENIIVGDGTSSGFLNNHIDVISRLKINKIAEKFGIITLDLNKAPFKVIKINKTNLKIAKICFCAELFINIPKMKTHAEAGLSVCLKNLIGCVVGLDKQKVHRFLPTNILELSKHIKPHLHIVDGLIAMEGTGPSRGKPIKMNLLIVGKDPLLIDLTCARIMDLKDTEIPYIPKNFIRKRSIFFNSLKLQNFRKKFEKPQSNLIASFINDPRYRNLFVKLRYSSILVSFFSSQFISKLLFILKIRQDMFIKENSNIKRVYINSEKCNNCELCMRYCPMGISPPTKHNNENCIKCLYCFFVCPRRAVQIEGRSGYLIYQINKYSELIRHIVNSGEVNADFK